jgi:hypothetical protein
VVSLIWFSLRLSLFAARPTSDALVEQPGPGVQTSSVTVNVHGAFQVSVNVHGNVVK